jgi:hypothetical protein
MAFCIYADTIMSGTTGKWRGVKGNCAPSCACRMD